METRANYLAIGLFTILVFMMAFGFVFWLKRYGDVNEARQIQLVIPANAGGLKVGSGVLFNGLRVGTVSDVHYSPDDPEHIYASLSVRPDIPLREDTKVGVEVQPLTGLSNVALVGGSVEKPALLEQEKMPILRAKASSLQDTIEAAGKAVETATIVLAKVDGLLANNSDKIATTVSNVEKFSTALANNADGIDELLKNVAQTSTALNALGETIGAVSDDIEKVVAAVDPEKVGKTLTHVEKITGDFARNSGEIDGIVKDAKAAVKNIADLSENLKQTAAVVDPKALKNTLESVENLTAGLGTTLEKVDQIVAAVDVGTVTATMASLNTFTLRLNSAGGEIDEILKNAKTATTDVTEFTKSLTGNKDNIDTIIKNATLISERLTGTSEAITRLIGRVDGLVEADGEGFIAEATEAASAIRKIAESFEARADDISSGLQRFSTRGLGDIETLIGESRQAVQRIEGIVSKIEANPTQFLLSGEQVPEYRPRR